MRASLLPCLAQAQAFCGSGAWLSCPGSNQQIISVTGALGWGGNLSSLPGNPPLRMGVHPTPQAEQVMSAAGALGPGADPSAGPCTGNPRFRTGVGYGGHPAGGAAAGYPGKVLQSACAPEITGWRCQHYLL